MVVVSAIDIGLMLLLFAYLVADGGMDAGMMGELFGFTIGHLLFPVITLILAFEGRHGKAIVVTLILGSLGSAAKIVFGIIALIIYFTDPGRKQYFEPLTQTEEVQTIKD